jgi:hypothetical protein
MEDLVDHFERDPIERMRIAEEEAHPMEDMEVLGEFCSEVIITDPEEIEAIVKGMEA